MDCRPLRLCPWFWYLAGAFAVLVTLPDRSQIDRRLGLQDQLSTAYHYAESGSRGQSASLRVNPEIVSRQRGIAEDLARTADLTIALPFTAPRSLYAGSALALVAASLVAVRYGVTRSLDLQPALVQISFAGLLGSEDVASAKKKTHSLPKPGDDRPKEDALNIDPWQSKTLDSQGPPDSALNTVDTPDVNNPNYNTASDPKTSGTPSQDPVQQPGESAEEGDKSGPGKDQNAENASAPNRDGTKQGKGQEGQQQEKPGNSSNDNSSLADKMRDAISNLMSKLNMQQKPGDNKQSSQGQQGSQQSAQKQGKDEKGTPQSGKQSDAMSSPDQQGDQEGQASDKSATAQNKSGSKDSDRPQSQDGKSGVGKEDGDKSAREAQATGRLGKITEIIGKRAANMSGEVMVEVSSGKQQLKTQYSQRKAAHADAGGELNRDEIPLAYQQFVQQYFEEIRKAPPAGSGSPKKTPGSQN